MGLSSPLHSPQAHIAISVVLSLKACFWCLRKIQTSVSRYILLVGFKFYKIFSSIVAVNCGYLATWWSGGKVSSNSTVGAVTVLNASCSADSWIVFNLNIESNKTIKRKA